MKHLPVPQIQGIIKDYHSRIIPDDKLSDGSNIMFLNGIIQSRWGTYRLKGTPLSGPITNIVYYDKLYDNTQYLVVFTTRDTYVYNENRGSFDFITRSYSTGTANLTSNSKTVNFTGSTFNNTDWSATSKYQIKFGDTDMNTAGTWYTVESIDSATAITLEEAVTLSAGTPYVLRLCWTGEITDYHDTALPYDKNENDKILVVTNGIDEMQKWNGTGSLELLGGTPPIAKYIDYFGSSGFEHLIATNVIDGSSQLSQSIYVSDAGETEVWSGTYYDLVDSNDPIVGVKALRSRMIVYKEQSISQMVPIPNGGNDDPFDFIQNQVSTTGTPSIRTVVEYDNFHIFFGHDNFYMYDGTTVKPIGTPIIKAVLSEINKSALDNAFAMRHPDATLYIFFVPTGTGETLTNKAYVYNYRDDNWTIWDLPANMVSWGTYRKKYSPSWASWSGISWADLQGRWRDYIILADNISYLIGDVDGNIYELSGDYTDDDGVPINCSMTTSDFDLNDPKHAVTLCELVIGLINKDAGNFRVRASVDFGATWSEWVTLDMDGDTTYIERTANFIERGLQARFQIENIGGAPIGIESMIIGFNDAGISRR